MTLPGDAISRFRRNSRHNILFKHQEAISIDKYELGLVRNYKHRIHLKNENPVYRKQFKIPEAHHNFMEQTLEEWLKLGVVWSSDSGKPGKNKLKAIQTAKAPADVKMIRSFGGLCNFFRTHIKDFAVIAAPLFRLTRKDSGYKGGPLPEAAMDAFSNLRK
jgi:hypothetical protein